MDDVRADAEDLHAVEVVEVVFEVELVEPERGEEGGEVGGLRGRAQEGEGEVGSGVVGELLRALWTEGVGERGWWDDLQEHLLLSFRRLEAVGY